MNYLLCCLPMTMNKRVMIILWTHIYINGSVNELQGFFTYSHSQSLHFSPSFYIITIYQSVLYLFFCYTGNFPEVVRKHHCRGELSL